MAVTTTITTSMIPKVDGVKCTIQSCKEFERLWSHMTCINAVSRIIENTPDSFFMNINKLLGEALDMLYKKLKEIPHVDCHHKTGSMFAMAKLNLSDVDDIVDDTNFCMKLAKEESMIVFPSNEQIDNSTTWKADGLKNWIRVSYSTEPKRLEEAIQRMKEFCYKHVK
ncbi:tyrosine/nicotianamine aminotransferase, pyridoxal phosphate-dependent transferase, partial [Tanacetum coccineum]